MQPTPAACGASGGGGFKASKQCVAVDTTWYCPSDNLCDQVNESCLPPVGGAAACTTASSGDGGSSSSSAFTMHGNFDVFSIYRYHPRRSIMVFLNSL